jgi:hypothetical protein
VALPPSFAAALPLSHCASPMVISDHIPRGLVRPERAALGWVWPRGACAWVGARALHSEQASIGSASSKGLGLSQLFHIVRYIDLDLPCICPPHCWARPPSPTKRSLPLALLLAQSPPLRRAAATERRRNDRIDPADDSTRQSFHSFYSFTPPRRQQSSLLCCLPLARRARALPPLGQRSRQLWA